MAIESVEILCQHTRVGGFLLYFRVSLPSGKYTLLNGTITVSEVGKEGWIQMETQKGDTEGDTNGRVTKGGILYRSESRAVLIYMRRLCLHSPMSHAV